MRCVLLATLGAVGVTLLASTGVNAENLGNEPGTAKDLVAESVSLSEDGPEYFAGLYAQAEDVHQRMAWLNLDFACSSFSQTNSNTGPACAILDYVEEDGSILIAGLPAIQSSLNVPETEEFPSLVIEQDLFPMEVEASLGETYGSGAKITFSFRF